MPKKHTVVLEDDCHTKMKLFTARRGMTAQDFFYEAAKAYINEHASTEERKYWPDSNNPPCT